MKKIALVFAAVLLAISGFAQKQAKYTENDVKQFYRTLQGDYSLQVNDSTVVMVHLTPIWETPENRFQWLYLEVTKERGAVMQKVLEVLPKNDKVFKIKVYDLKHPEQFEGKWGNRNYFDGFTTSILKGGRKISFLKTSNFSYQTHWLRIQTLECFPKGDLLHFKFVQEDERFYIKRMPAHSTRIIGFQGLKELTDGGLAD